MDPTGRRFHFEIEHAGETTKLLEPCGWFTNDNPYLVRSAAANLLHATLTANVVGALRWSHILVYTDPYYWWDTLVYITFGLFPPGPFAPFLLLAQHELQQQALTHSTIRCCHAALVYAAQFTSGLEDGGVESRHIAALHLEAVARVVDRHDPNALGLHPSLLASLEQMQNPEAATAWASRMKPFQFLATLFSVEEQEDEDQDAGVAVVNAAMAETDNGFEWPQPQSSLLLGTAAGQLFEFAPHAALPAKRNVARWLPFLEKDDGTAVSLTEYTHKLIEHVWVASCRFALFVPTAPVELRDRIKLHEDQVDSLTYLMDWDVMAVIDRQYQAEMGSVSDHGASAQRPKYPFLNNALRPAEQDDGSFMLSLLPEQLEAFLDVVMHQTMLQSGSHAGNMSEAAARCNHFVMYLGDVLEDASILGCDRVTGTSTEHFTDQEMEQSDVGEAYLAHCKSRLMAIWRNPQFPIEHCMQFLAVGPYAQDAEEKRRRVEWISGALPEEQEEGNRRNVQTGRCDTKPKKKLVRSAEAAEGGGSSAATGPSDDCMEYDDA